MANKIVKHCYNSVDSSEIRLSSNLEPDKTKSISQLTLPELYKMMERLRTERDLGNLIKELKRNSGEREHYEEPWKIDTETPIEQLYHHGIVGMKWGVRRYQNKDGTRTTLGKKREAGEPNSEDHIKSRSAKEKGVNSLSNDELRKLNERLQLESTYKNLTMEKIKKSESWVQRSMEDIGKQTLTAVGTGLLIGSAKLLVREVSPQLAEAGFGIKEKKS